MATISFNGENYPCKPGDSVLDVLLSADIQIPNSCRAGVCQSCMMRSLDTKPPEAAQKGLKDTLQHQKYFLACSCYPEHDMVVSLPKNEGFAISAQVIRKDKLSANIMRLVLAIEGELEFLAGQFVNLSREDGLTRNYSIANSPHQGNFLEFHIQRLPNGKFSTWIHEEVEVGTMLTVSEPKGSCHYLPGRFEQPMMLVGTGSGLAPLYGILNDALNQGHSGPIRLFHGSRHPDGLYLIDEMKKLDETFDNFEYIPCISGEMDSEGFAKGRVHDVALSSTASLTGWKVFLCGHPEMVSHTKKMAYLKGASLSDIYADAFHIGQIA